MTAETTNARRLRRTEAMLTAPVAATVARLAAPNVLGMVAMILISIAEASYAAILGIEALAALALVFPFVMLSQTLSGGAIGGSVSAAVARALGARDEEAAGRIAFHALLIAVTAALTLCTLFLLFGRLAFDALGGQGRILELALSYGWVFFPGAAAMWLSQTSASILRGTGDMARPAAALLGIALLSATFSGAFSLGWGPFPALGVPGLALGLVTGHAVTALVLIAGFARGSLGFPVFAVLRPARRYFHPILRVGLVAMLSPTQTILTTLIVTGFAARYGAEALAGYGLGARLEFLMIPVTFGFGAAATAMVGTNIGAGQTGRAKRIAWTASGMAAAAVGSIGLAVAVFPHLWLGLFLDDPAGGVWTAAALYLRIVAPFYAFLAIGLALYFASQGAGHVLWPVLAVSARLAIAVAGGALVVGMGWGATALYVVIALAMIAYGTLTALSVHLQTWGR